MREVAQDAVVGKDLTLRKGQLVAFRAYASARNPCIWGPDAAEFKPERWIDPDTGKIRTFAPGKFYSFSAGPRQCVGMGLAMLQLRVLTANLLHRYKFEIDTEHNDGSYVPAVTLDMKFPLLAKAVRLK